MRNFPPAMPVASFPDGVELKYWQIPMYASQTLSPSLRVGRVYFIYAFDLDPPPSVISPTYICWVVVFLPRVPFEHRKTYPLENPF